MIRTMCRTGICMINMLYVSGVAVVASKQSL